MIWLNCSVQCARVPAQDWSSSITTGLPRLGVRFSLGFLAVSSEFGIACWATTTPPRIVSQARPLTPLHFYSYRNPKENFEIPEEISKSQMCLQFHHLTLTTFKFFTEYPPFQIEVREVALQICVLLLVFVVSCYCNYISCCNMHCVCCVYCCNCYYKTSQ